MEAEVTTMASESSSSKLDFQMHCVTCGIHKYWTPRRWECDVCRDYFQCENCYKGSVANGEVVSAPPRVQCRDHPMSPYFTISSCDGCGSSPIWNIRWHCTVCVDFDLCEACHGALDATDMPLEHLQEHPMIAIEVICPEMLLKLQPSFSKPVDPQWSYKVYENENSLVCAFYWERRKPILEMLSGMDDAIVYGNAMNDNRVPISKLQEQSLVHSKFFSSKQGTHANQTHGGFDMKHKIFLSHAGTEKDFVDQLFQDLLRLHHFGIFFDKDDDSLPRGEPFPERIFDAAKHCELAIVVISHEYFIRKWPMLELAAFVKAKSTRRELKILPVFYKLSVEEFKEQCHLFERHWREKPLVSKDEMDGWKEALKVISRTNGLEYEKRRGEVDFRDRIIEVVYKRVKPELLWDDSHVQGKLRMQETMQEMIRLSRNASGEGLMASTLRVGLFGMGGSGKTTMCKVWCNGMMAHFMGKVHHMEFGSADLLHMRIKLLQSICGLESRFLETVDEGQALTLLKIHIPKQEVFLVIDNVSDDSCIEEARNLLNLPFKEGSVIVVTSRSSIILETLKIEQRLTMRIPSLTTVEAKVLFRHHAGCDATHLTNEQVKGMESFVEQCKFQVQGFDAQEYHPLALKVLGIRVGPNAMKWRKMKIDFKHYENEKKHPIFSILRSSFDALDLKYQRIFLDIALSASSFCLSMIGLKALLRNLHDEIDKEFGFQVVEVLQAQSLVEFYDVESQSIYVHDLYREFARMEVEKKGLQHSGRCCFSRGHHVIQRGRIHIHNHPLSHITKDILSCTICREAQLLNIEDCANLVSIDVEGMENLRMINVIGGCPKLSRFNLECAVNLRSIEWLGFKGECFPNLTSMESLEVLKLGQHNDIESLVTLHGCLDFSRSSNLEVLKLSYLPLKMLNLNHVVLLKSLYLGNCQHLERFEGLEALRQLELLWLYACSSLVEFPSLANFPSLESFRLRGVAKLKEILGFSNLIALSILEIDGGLKLEELPGIEACTRLSQLWLSGTNIKDCSWICKMKDLTIIHLCGTKIRFVPDCCDLWNLSKLCLDDCEAFESVGDNTGLIPSSFPRSLQEFSARKCLSLNVLPEFHYESLLCLLNLHKSSVEDVSSIACCKQLQQLYCGETRITRLPDLSSLMRLEVLDVCGCKLLVRMDNIKFLPALKRLQVDGCTSLLTLPDLQSSMQLTKLSLWECPLVDPNVVQLPNTCSIDMDKEDVVDNELEEETEYLTSRVTDIEEPEYDDDLWRFATLINLVGKIVSWCCGFRATWALLV